jgi:hypothetical protein
MKVEITKHQLRAIIEAANTLSGMLGCPDEDFNTEGEIIVKAIDAFLKKNGYKRQFT